MPEHLSKSQLVALRIASESPLISSIPAVSTRDSILGDTVPGMRVYQKLVAMDLALITDENLMDEEHPELGTWTPSIQLTDHGLKVFEAHRERQSHTGGNEAL